MFNEVHVLCTSTLSSRYFKSTYLIYIYECLIAKYSFSHILHAEVNINQLNVRVYGIIGGIPVEFTMPQPNACIDSGLKCPLSDRTPVEYLTYVPVLPMYPNVCGSCNEFKSQSI